MAKREPKSIMEMKHAKFFITAYLKEDVELLAILEDKSIFYLKGFKGDFVAEVLARFIEYFQGDYRLGFEIDGVKFDNWYPTEAKFRDYGKYVFALRTEFDPDEWPAKMVI